MYKVKSGGESCYKLLADFYRRSLQRIDIPFPQGISFCSNNSATKNGENRHKNPSNQTFSPQKSPNFATNGRISPHSALFGHIFHTARHDDVLLRRFRNKENEYQFLI
jgi:hypothetical protein